MATLEQAERAFLNAHNAGDTENAGILAQEVKRLRQAVPADDPAATPPPAPGLGAIDMNQTTFSPQQAGPGVGMSPRADQALRNDYIPPAVQGVGAGVAETIGAAPDLANLMNPAAHAYNAYQSAAKLTGLPQGPANLFPNFSEAIKNKSADVASQFGYETQNPKAMPWDDSLKYHSARMTTQVAPGLALFRGLGLARAAELEAGNAKPSFIDPIVRPYASPNPAQVARTAAGDLASAVGSGAAVSGIEQSGFSNPATDFAGTMGGGVAGNKALNMVTAIPRFAKATLSNIFGANTKVPLDPNIPFHLQQTPSGTVTNKAAEILQGGATNPAEALNQINMNRTTLGDTMTVSPTTAALSADPGIQRVQQALNQRNPAFFDENRRQFNTDVLDTLEQKTVPPGADPSVFQGAVREEVQGRQLGAQQFTEQAEQNAARVAAERQQQALPFTEAQNPSVPASERFHRQVVDQSLDPMTRTKSLDFAQAPNAPTDTRALVETAEQLRGEINRQPGGFREAVNPAGLLEGIERLAVRDPETGAIIETRPVGLQDLNKMRATLSGMEAAARESGAAPGMLDNLRRLRNVITTLTDAHPDNARAVDRFTNQFAPVWGRQAPEAHAFRESYQLDPLGESRVPPEKTAGALIKPEAPSVTAQVRNIVQSIEQPAQMHRAIEDVLRADMAKSGAVDSAGNIVPGQIEAWMRKHTANIDLVPGLRERLTGPQGPAAVGRAGEQAAVRAAEDVKSATKSQQLVDKIIKESGLGDVVNAQDLDKIMVKVLGDATSSGAKLDNLIRLAKERGQQATDGLKKAVQTWLIDKTETQGIAETKPGDMRGAPSWPNINKVMKEHGEELAKLYSPEEMQALRRVHHAMALKAAGEQRTGPGSTDTVANLNANPVDRLRNTALGKGVEAVARYHMGALAAGGKIGAVRRAFHGVNDAQAAEIEKLLVRASFEPEVAMMLLGHKLPVGSPKWNSRISALLGTSEAVRDFREEEDPEQANKRAATRKAVTPSFMTGAP